MTARRKEKLNVAQIARVFPDIFLSESGTVTLMDPVHELVLQMRNPPNELKRLFGEFPVKEIVELIRRFFPELHAAQMIGSIRKFFPELNLPEERIGWAFGQALPRMLAPTLMEPFAQSWIESSPRQVIEFIRAVHGAYPDARPVDIVKWTLGCRRQLTARIVVEMAEQLRRMFRDLNANHVVQIIQGRMREVDADEIVEMIRQLQGTWQELTSSHMVPIIQTKMREVNAADIVELTRQLRGILPDLSLSHVIQIIQANMVALNLGAANACTFVETLCDMFPGNTLLFSAVKREFPTLTGLVDLRTLFAHVKHFPPLERKQKSQIEGRFYTGTVELDVPDGIIAHLTRECGGNVHRRHVVDITSGSFETETQGANPYSGTYDDNPDCAPGNLADLESDSWYCSASRIDHIPHTPNNWVCYDFKERRIVPTDYTIRTNGLDSNLHHLKSWLIETLVDGETWREVARKEDNKQLQGRRYAATFAVAGGGECRFIRLVNVGTNHLGSDQLLISAWEVFGSLVE